MGGRAGRRLPGRAVHLRGRSSPSRLQGQVQGGTLQISGDAASDKLGLQVSPVDPNVLQVDVGEDGTTDFSFDRTTFTAIDVEAGGGDDEVRIGSGTNLGNVT